MERAKQVTAISNRTRVVALRLQNHYYQSLMGWLSSEHGRPADRRPERAHGPRLRPTSSSQEEQDDVLIRERPFPEQRKRGLLTAVGTGIRAVGQLYGRGDRPACGLPTSSCTASAIRSPSMSPSTSMNENGAESMFHYYEENKPQAQTYEQMIQRMLECVREGMQTCVALHGHPGVFAWPAHEAIRRARGEGYEACTLPAVSAEDCLFADCGIDPAMTGAASPHAGDRFHDQRLRHRHVEHRHPVADRRAGRLVVQDRRLRHLVDAVAARALAACSIPRNHQAIVYEAAASSRLQADDPS